MRFKVALLQILPERDPDSNLKKAKEHCKTAKGLGADIALFPEMFSCGYNIPENTEELKSLAIGCDSRFLTELSLLARELDMAICATYLEQYSPLPRNSLCIFDRHGKRILDYAKVHTCDFGDEARLCAGDDFYVAPLDTKDGEVNIGAMICYDREFPESARILMLKGAEIILVPNACPMEINRISQLRGRAYENMVGIATCNYPSPHPDCNGHSNAFDGVAYLPELQGSRDTKILEADWREDIFIADFDIDMLRAYRESEVHGNAYRHPEKYSLLLSKNINPPFVRGDKKS